MYKLFNKLLFLFLILIRQWKFPHKSLMQATQSSIIYIQYNKYNLASLIVHSRVVQKMIYLIFPRENWLSMQKFCKDTTNRPHINSWTILCRPKQQFWGPAQNGELAGVKIILLSSFFQPSALSREEPVYTPKRKHKLSLF